MIDENEEFELMDKCGMFTGKSVEEAKRRAADTFEVPIDEITFKVLEVEKKGFFGKTNLIYVIKIASRFSLCYIGNLFFSLKLGMTNVFFLFCFFRKCDVF